MCVVYVAMDYDLDMCVCDPPCADEELYVLKHVVANWHDFGEVTADRVFMNKVAGVVKAAHRIYELSRQETVPRCTCRVICADPYMYIRQHVHEIAAGVDVERIRQYLHNRKEDIVGMLNGEFFARLNRPVKNKKKELRLKLGWTAVQQPQPPSNLRCKRGDDCRYFKCETHFPPQPEKCPYYKHLCLDAQCTLEHPLKKCPYYNECLDAQCPLEHPKSPSEEPSVIKKDEIPCRRGIGCPYMNCKFNHPEGRQPVAKTRKRQACRYANRCPKKYDGCPFYHDPTVYRYTKEVALKEHRRALHDLYSRLNT